VESQNVSKNTGDRQVARFAAGAGAIGALGSAKRMEMSDCAFVGRSDTTTWLR
jgi:hypothetical protein